MILEEIRSQNSATMEAVEASRAAIEQRIDHLEHETGMRDSGLEMAVRELRLDIRQLQGDVGGLAARVEALAHIEERVTAIERRLLA